MLFPGSPSLGATAGLSSSVFPAKLSGAPSELRECHVSASSINRLEQHCWTSQQCLPCRLSGTPSELRECRMSASSINRLEQHCWLAQQCRKLGATAGLSSSGLPAKLSGTPAELRGCHVSASSISRLEQHCWTSQQWHTVSTIPANPRTLHPTAPHRCSSKARLRRVPLLACPAVPSLTVTNHSNKSNVIPSIRGRSGSITYCGS